MKFTQALSENFVTFAGKLNMFDEFKMPFTGDRLFDGFWNLGMSFPLSWPARSPIRHWAPEPAVLKDGVPVFTVMVLDTNNTPTTSGFDQLFDNGATIFANLKLPTKFFGLPGSPGNLGHVQQRQVQRLAPTAYFDPSEGLVVTPNYVRDSWCVFYSATQALWVDPCNPKRVYGVYTNIGTADDGPSPIRFSANVGALRQQPDRQSPARYVRHRIRLHSVFVARSQISPRSSCRSAMIRPSNSSTTSRSRLGSTWPRTCKSSSRPAKTLCPPTASRSTRPSCWAFGRRSISRRLSSSPARNPPPSAA